MAQRTKTVEYVLETGTALRSTVTALAGTNFYTPAAITVYLPETDATRTIRSVELIITARDAETTTARRFDGARVGVQVDAVAWSDLDLTGTGITNTGDHYSVAVTRDVTSYFVTNFTGASHSVGARVEFETDVASNVNCITVKFRITYEYNDSSATHVKTVRIPLGGNTGVISTAANTNFGSSAIPALDTFLPESTGRTYRHIWFEVYSTDGGAATTDFNLSLSVDGATTSVRANCEQGLNTSVSYYDIWIPGGGNGVGYFTTNATHNFQAWSSLFSRFERTTVLLCVTYTYTRVTSGSVINSLVIPVRINNTDRIAGSSTGGRDRFETDVWVEEANPTLVQSALFASYVSATSSTIDLLVNQQNAVTYTNTALLHSGTMYLMHRLDVGHGGSAVTIARGKNTLTVDVHKSSTTNTTGSGFTGVLYLNYTSDVHASGEGVHNHTTWWCITDTMSGAIAGEGFKEITTNIRTPSIPETAAFYQGCGVEYLQNANASATASYIAMAAEIGSGELSGDGWAVHVLSYTTDGEFGMHLRFLVPEMDYWDRWIDDPLGRLNPETARTWRMISSHNAHYGACFMLTYHAITFSIAGDVTGSSGGTVNITAHRTDTGEQVASTSRAGNGAYSMSVYDNTLTYFTAARESGVLIARSDNGTPT